MIVFPYGVERYGLAGEAVYLREGLWILGVILLIAGFRHVRKLYPRLPGLPINSAKVAVIYDICLLLLSVPAAYVAICWFLKSAFDIRPLMDEDEMFFLGTFFLLFSVPFVCGFTDRYTSQSVEVDDQAISLHDSSMTTRLQWQELDEIDLSDENVMVGRAGVSVPKTVQRRLVLKAADGREMIINEPQLKKSKREFLDLLQQHAPESAEKALTALREVW